MSNRHPLNWSAALRGLKADRLARQPVREERLRTATALRGTPALALSGWRGASGRRYVTSVFYLPDFDPTEAVGHVVLFVARDEAGIARIVLGGRDLDAIAVSGLASEAKLLRCTEAHCHRLADDEEERVAILSDLLAPAMEIA